MTIQISSQQKEVLFLGPSFWVFIALAILKDDEAYLAYREIHLNAVAYLDIWFLYFPLEELYRIHTQKKKKKKVESQEVQFSSRYDNSDAGNRLGNCSCFNHFCPREEERVLLFIRFPLVARMQVERILGKLHFAYIMEQLTKAVLKSNCSSFTYSKEEQEGLVCPQSFKFSNFIMKRVSFRGFL